MSTFAERLQLVLDKIADAARRGGRSPEEVTLVAVSKRKPAADLARAVALGQLALGENYVQEMLAKQDDPTLAEAPIDWHYIGPLQRNKVRHIVGRVALLHAVDSSRLVDEIDKRSAAASVRTPLLIQVNLSGEDTKSGCTAEEAEQLVRHAAQLEHIELRGFMTMPAPSPNPEDARPVFRQLRQLRDDIAGRLPQLSFPDLSMGMSADFEIAVEEGATLVRVGSLIFGARD